MIPAIGDEMLIKQKEIEYGQYINEHICNVKKVFDNLQKDIVLLDMINELLADENRSLDDLSNNIEIHDESKFSTYEFDAYRRNLFPISDEEKEDSKLDYEIAWDHHKRHNLHHWDGWYEENIPNNMPMIYVIEMFCDHAAMSMKFGGKCIDWYNKEKKKDKIHLGIRQEQVYLAIAQRYYKVYDEKGNKK